MKGRNEERKRHLDLRHFVQIVVKVSWRGQEHTWAANVEHVPVIWRACRMRVGVTGWDSEVDG